MSAVRPAPRAAEAEPGRTEKASQPGGYPSAMIRLGPRPHRIYILPTRHGVSFAFALFAMLVGAVNYNNALAYVLTFLLGSLALVSLLHTHRNLAGLRLGVAAPRPVFAGAMARFYVTIDNRGQPARHAVIVRWCNDPEETRRPDAVSFLGLAGDSIARELIEVAAPKRGWQALGRVIIATRFPFGLFRAWCPLTLDTQCLVYPRSEGRQPLPARPTENHRESGLKGTGRDDFSGLRDYVPGDSPRQIHWKAAAREQGLPVKLFSGASAGDLLLRWADVDAGGIEAQLSQLCRWVLDAEAGGFRYGVELPGNRLDAGDGDAHRHGCLKALALYGSESAR